MRRGEVRWYNFERPNKRRPVLVLTRDAAIPLLHEITVAQITTTIRAIPEEVYLDQSDGMERPCVVNLDHIQTVPKYKLGTLISVLSRERMSHVGLAIVFALGFEDEMRQG